MPVASRAPRPLPSAQSPCPPAEPGLVVDADGTGVLGVVAPRAEALELCVRAPGSLTERRTPMRRTTGGMWWTPVHGMTPGTEYGLRAHGPWRPESGAFFNPGRVLLDPRGRAVSHAAALSSPMFAHEVDAMLAPAGGTLVRAEDDNAEHAVWSAVVDPRFPWGPDRLLRTPWTDTVLYEAHVKGLTALHPHVPAPLRGTYAGLAHPAVTGYLRELGVTAVELLPIHAGMDEPHLARLGLDNYWGYSTLSYFAPEPSYATERAQRRGPQAVVDEVKEMVRGLHAAGLEVICDVVYNHSAEGGADGPTLSLRGLDAREFSWLEHGQFVDVTGTGGTLDMRSPHVVDLILSSLRHWVSEYHIDGFRFDLAATLGRDDRGFRADHPLLRAITLDPVLRGVKLIAEPWDIGGGGWQTGSFPPPFAEWNDAFRDDVRDFWLARAARSARSGHAEGTGVRSIATRLAGSADILTRHDPASLPSGAHLRAPWASIDYVTAHDGFTLRDLTMYEAKHNHANGEDNRDGSENNRSFHHGHEGDVDAAAPEGARIEDQRRRSARAMLATLLLSAGTPMLTAGDEAMRTQGGNNNAYCQDNETSWVSWEHDADARALSGLVSALLALRGRFARLHPETFSRPADPAAPAVDQVGWMGADGSELRHEDWFDTHRHVLQMLRPGPATAEGPDDGHLLVIVNGEEQDVTVRLPAAPWGGRGATVLLETAPEPEGAREREIPPGQTELVAPARGIQVLLLHR